jgi:hypothetical protein
LALTTDNAPNEIKEEVVGILPPFVTVKDHQLDITEGDCVVSFLMELPAAKPKKAEVQKEEGGYDSDEATIATADEDVAPEDDEEEISPVIVTLDASLIQKKQDELVVSVAVAYLITCDLPPKREQDDAKQKGSFCAASSSTLARGVAQNEALCIPEDRAWDTDDRGCCGEDCPTRPRPVDIECTEDAADSCEMRNREDGVFVCRTLFHPVDGEIRERSLCIPSDRAWVTDTCGCCEDESGCPATPE